MKNAYSKIEISFVLGMIFIMFILYLIQTKNQEKRESLNKDVNVVRVLKTTLK